MVRSRPYLRWVKREDAVKRRVVRGCRSVTQRSKSAPGPSYERVDCRSAVHVEGPATSSVDVMRRPVRGLGSGVGGREFGPHLYEALTVRRRFRRFYLLIRCLSYYDN